MRQVVRPDGAPASALGFGCASLGSRIAPALGAKAIEQALQAGVTWFDVAPSYGDGRAEEILGAALRGTNASIATKVGLVAPGRSVAKRAIGAFARPLVSAVPALRPLVKRLRPDATQRLPLEPETIRVSLARSLERLNRPSVAMLALHDPLLADVQNEAVIRALDDVKREGLAAMIGIAGSTQAVSAAIAAGLTIDIAQTAQSPFDRSIALLPTAVPFRIAHSVFGVGGALDRLKRLTKTPQGIAALASLGFESVPDLLLAYAFAANPAGIVLTSSYGSGHLATNAAAAAKAPDTALVAKVDAALASLDDAQPASATAA